ncbi:MAG: hypothetical protein DHS20C08_01190 [Rhodomicrobium sp.]|nr:MAG: hypothetical protein DHS20C08_01190 [Rhodomicrobium sp.]
MGPGKPRYAPPLKYIILKKKAIVGIDIAIASGMDIIRSIQKILSSFFKA